MPRDEPDHGTGDETVQPDAETILYIRDEEGRNVLVMSEQSRRLEPGILGLKFHAIGFGQIKESVPEGPHETLSLVSVTRGS